MVSKNNFPEITMHAALFLDRDGVINVDTGYVGKTGDFEFTDGIFEAVGDAYRKGYRIIVVTNQSGIARGYYGEEDFQVVTDWMIARFADHGVAVTQVYHCPHGPTNGCACRKPKPGMLLKAINDHNLDPAVCWMVGDSERDIVAAHAVDVENTVFLGQVREDNPSEARYTVSSIIDLIDLLPARPTAI